MRKPNWKSACGGAVLAVTLAAGAGPASAAGWAEPRDGLIQVEQRRGDYHRGNGDGRYRHRSDGYRQHGHHGGGRGYSGKSRRWHDHGYRSRSGWSPYRHGPYRHGHYGHHYYAPRYYYAPRHDYHRHVHGPYCGHAYYSPYGHLVDFLYAYSYYD